jgi:hypothetical protein
MHYLDELTHTLYGEAYERALSMLNAAPVSSADEQHVEIDNVTDEMLERLRYYNLRSGDTDGTT